MAEMPKKIEIKVTADTGKAQALIAVAKAATDLRVHQRAGLPSNAHSDYGASLVFHNKERALVRALDEALLKLAA